MHHANFDKISALLLKFRGFWWFQIFSFTTWFRLVSTPFHGPELRTIYLIKTRTDCILCHGWAPWSHVFFPFPSSSSSFFFFAVGINCNNSPHRSLIASLGELGWHSTRWATATSTQWFTDDHTQWLRMVTHIDYWRSHTMITGSHTLWLVMVTHNDYWGSHAMIMDGHTQWLPAVTQWLRTVTHNDYGRSHTMITGDRTQRLLAVTHNDYWRSHTMITNGHTQYDFFRFQTKWASTPSLPY